MQSASITLCKALAQVLDAHYRYYDHETSALLVALNDYVHSKESK